MRKILGLILFLFFITVSPSFAQTPTINTEQSTKSAQETTESGSMSPQVFDKFTVFWPMVAGKTQDDSLYFLKNLKEELRGFLIFGKPQKAEYNITLATKRILEADKLIENNKIEIASQTLDKAIQKIDEAKSLLQDSKNDKSYSVSSGNVKVKLSNIDDFLEFIIQKGSPSQEKIEEVKQKVLDLNSSI